MHVYEALARFARWRIKLLLSSYYEVQYNFFFLSHTLTNRVNFFLNRLTKYEK